MELTKKQAEGLEIAISRYNRHEPYTCIAGYAGTGKSTLVHFIVEALDLNPQQVCYVAFTGKAALVLREKGCANAMTAHKLLYKSYQNTDGTYKHIPKRPLEGAFKVIIVDEVSMLPKEMWDLLISHHIHVIALGDPGQLPPIGEENGVLSHPHVFLDEIMRQAEESEIIRLTMDIREEKPLQVFQGDEVQILPSNMLSGGMLDWANKIIVGKNVTRNKINNLMRYKIFNTHSREPKEGDLMICLRNYWEVGNDLDDVLVNGMCGKIYNIRTFSSPFPPYEVTKVDFVPDMYDLSLEEAYDRKNPCLIKDIIIDKQLLMTGEPTVNKKNFKRYPKQLRPLEFDYGYCITCHKSQGSEYDKVLVLEEMLRQDEHSRWLYTAATRAKDKLVIVKDFKD